jgi:hypothetical protein
MTQRTSVDRKEWDELIKNLIESEDNETETLLINLPEVKDEVDSKQIRRQVRKYYTYDEDMKNG